MNLVASVILTVIAYLASLKIRRHIQLPFTAPVFTGTVFIISFLVLSGNSYEEYAKAKGILTYMLGPATAALAVPLYKNRQLIAKYALPAFAGIITGLAVGLITAFTLAVMFKLPIYILQSLAVKSVTVPIAVEVTGLYGGYPELSAGFVIMTGMLGSMAGPWILSRLHINGPFSRGIALGTVAHGMGTAQAAQENEISGAASAAAMAISAALLSLFFPVFNSAFL